MHNFRLKALIASISLMHLMAATGQEPQQDRGRRVLLVQKKPVPKPANLQVAAEGAGDEAAKPDENKQEKWWPLLPSKSLDGWQKTDFYGEQKVSWDGKTLVLEAGEPLNGIDYKGKDYPKSGYEIRLEARRVEGSDFFCGLTFPVGDKFCSFIAGGWGGGMVGLSNVDGFDASENATSNYHDFENNRWYKFLVHVDDKFIRATIDGEEFIEQEREYHDFDTRLEVNVCRPIGLCAYMSKVEIRNFQWRSLDPNLDSKILAATRKSKQISANGDSAKAPAKSDDTLEAKEKEEEDSSAAPAESKPAESKQEVKQQ